jgi:hypothetical protein
LFTYIVTILYLRLTPLCSGLGSPQLLSPNIWCPTWFKPKNNSDKTTQMKTYHKPLAWLYTQPACTIIVATERPTFDNILEAQLLQANMSTAAGTSQNGGCSSSVQTSGGDWHQSPPRAPPPSQVLRGQAAHQRAGA